MPEPFLRLLNSSEFWNFYNKVVLVNFFKITLGATHVRFALNTSYIPQAVMLLSSDIPQNDCYKNFEKVSGKHPKARLLKS